VDDLQGTMASPLLEKYQDGHREQVWQDLIQLGGAVRRPEYLSDAKAVARETMLRARQNVETLITRLHEIGYEFQTSEMSRYESSARMGQALQFAGGIADMAAALGALQNPQTSGLLSMIQKLTGKASAQKQSPPAPPPPAKDPLHHPDIWSRPDKKTRQELDQFEKTISGPLPLSLRAWCEEVGSVSLMGSHPALGLREGRSDQPVRVMMAGGPTRFASAAQKAGIEIISELPRSGNEVEVLGDPLVVQPYFDEWDDEDDLELDELSLAPDADHKANQSGGDPYTMKVPNAAADGMFLDGNNLHFVEYLRVVFRYGGFPGFANAKQRPSKELTFLAEGLLPI
jgi:hypothetical protein